MEKGSGPIIIIVLVAIIIVAAAAVFWGGGKAPAGQGQTTQSPTPTGTTTTPPGGGNTSTGLVEWSPDGVISEGEYQSEYTLADGNFKLYLRVEGDTIYIGMAGKTRGWVAIGIEPTYMMKDADMIIAWVDANGTVHVEDAYSTGATGPHPVDTQLGGTNDILQYGGKEQGGWTIIELARKLDTGDQYDKPLQPGSTVKIIYGMSSQDSFKAYHDVTAGYANITIPG